MVDRSEFERCVRASYSFLEDQYGAEFRGVRVQRGDPRDAATVASYSLANGRLDLAIDATGIPTPSMHFHLDGPKASAYIEPLLFFVTQGRVSPVVPHIYPSMPSSSILTVANQRDELVEAYGWEKLLGLIADRLRENMVTLMNVSQDDLEEYNSWFKTFTPAHQKKNLGI